MTGRVFFAGTDDEVAPHARPLMEHLPLEISGCEQIRERAVPGDVCLFYNEFFDRYRDLCRELNQRGCRTVYAIDGILEWRNLWENPPAHPLGGEPHANTMRPVLSQVAACIGPSQARQLACWGNAGKCVVVGVPRFDSLSGGLPAASRESPPTLLVATAKNPGFTVAQREITLRSLALLRERLMTRFREVRVIWRITAGLDRQLGVASDADPLDRQLKRAHAVITTPSTLMLEAMLSGRPVSLLDFHNCPQYVRGAWCISAESQIDPVIEDLLQPSHHRLQCQAEFLHDAVRCDGSAAERMAALLQALRDAPPEMETSGILAPFREEPALQLPAPSLRQDEADQGFLAEQSRRIEELQQRLRVAEGRLQAFEVHPVAGPVLRLRRRFARWLGQNDLPAS